MYYIHKNLYQSDREERVIKNNRSNVCSCSILLLILIIHSTWPNLDLETFLEVFIHFLSKKTC